MLPGQRRVHQRHGFVADVGRARRIAKVDALIKQLAQQQQPLGQRGGQDQAGVGHQVLVIEADRDRVGTAAGSHLTGAFLIGLEWPLQQPILPGHQAPVHRFSRPISTDHRWIRAEEWSSRGGVVGAAIKPCQRPARRVQVQIWSLTWDGRGRILCAWIAFAPIDPMWRPVGLLADAMPARPWVGGAAPCAEESWFGQPSSWWPRCCWRPQRCSQAPRRPHHRSPATRR
jgi:hypothetical protein